MNIFIYNLDRVNEKLVKSLEDFLIKKEPLLSFGAVKAEVIAKNNGYLILNPDEKEQSAIWTVVKMLSNGCSASYWITDYGDTLKFITLKKKIHEFKSFPVKKEVKKVVTVDQSLADSIKDSMQQPPPPKKEVKRLEKIKLEDLTPTNNFTLDVKFNPNKPLSLAQVNKEKMLVKIPQDSWLVIRGSNFNTNSEDIKNLLMSKEFVLDESIQAIV